MPWVQSAGPSTEDSGSFDKDPAPSMIAWFMRNQATPSPSRASMASMNQGRPCAARLVRTGNRVGSAASLAGSVKPGTSTARSRDSVTRTVAQGWSSPSGQSVLSITLTRPPSVTDRQPGSQNRHRGRAQEPGRRGDRRAPFPLLRQRLDFRRQQACDRAALQAGKGAGGERRGLPAIGAEGLEDGQGHDILEMRNVEH